METVCIYLLIDPRTGAGFYVGKTVNFSHRFWGHIGQRKGGTSAAQRYMQDLVNSGHYPHYKILDEITASAVWIRELEKLWIQHCAAKMLLANRNWARWPRSCGFDIIELHRYLEQGRSFADYEQEVQIMAAWRRRPLSIFTMPDMRWFDKAVEQAILEGG